MGAGTALRRAALHCLPSPPPSGEGGAPPLTYPGHLANRWLSGWPPSWGGGCPLPLLSSPGRHTNRRLPGSCSQARRPRPWHRAPGPGHRAQSRLACDPPAVISPDGYRGAPQAEGRGGGGAAPPPLADPIPRPRGLRPSLALGLSRAEAPERHLILDGPHGGPMPHVLGPRKVRDRDTKCWKG